MIDSIEETKCQGIREGLKWEVWDEEKRTREEHA